jgi:hypothetical protein
LRRKKEISSGKILGLRKIGSLLRFQILAEKVMQNIAQPKIAQFEIAEENNSQ